jgi:hypothetical protein
LFYLIELQGSFQEHGTMQGSGGLDEYVSNCGRMSGGIDDPVWITVPNTTQSTLGNMILIVAVVGVVACAGVGGGLLLMRRGKNKTPTANM